MGMVFQVLVCSFYSFVVGTWMLLVLLLFLVVGRTIFYASSTVAIGGIVSSFHLIYPTAGRLHLTVQNR